MIEVVTANSEMLRAFYPGMEVPVFYGAFMVFEDGNPVAVGGLFHAANDEAVLFSDAPPGWIAKHPKVTVRITKALLSFAAHHGLVVRSFADEDIEKAGDYLEHFGFVKKGDCHVWFGKFFV